MRLLILFLLSLIATCFPLSWFNEAQQKPSFILRTGNDSLDKDISGILFVLADDSLVIPFLQAYQSRQIYFVPQKHPDRIVDLVVYKGSPLRYKFRYDYKEYQALPSDARKAIIIHEMYHIYRGLNSNNDHDHEEMTKDPLYLQALEKIFPDRPFSFYDQMSYAGTIGSPVFEQLSLNHQNELIDFFHRNKIYY